MRLKDSREKALIVDDELSYVSCSGFGRSTGDECFVCGGGEKQEGEETRGEIPYF